MEKIIYIRSTSIVNDSRANKEIKSYLEGGFDVHVLGWNRQDIKNIKIEVEKKQARIELYEKNSNYGDGFKTIFKFAGYQLWIYKKLLKNKKNFEIIHACDFDTAFVSYIFAKLHKKKFIYDIYDYYVDAHNLSFLKGIVEKIDINIINNSDCVYICTEQRKDQIKKASPKKLKIIHNTPDFNVKCLVPLQNKKIKLGYVGILQNDRLLCEVGEEIAKNQDIELHIGGFGKYEEFFKNLSKKYNNIKYYGQMKYDDVLELEKKCDVLFATYNPNIENHKYSAPNKVYEAMALGKPIIVCKNTGVDELVIKENIGYSINYDAKELVEVLKNITKQEYEKMSKNGNKIYDDKYSWKIMSKRIIETVGELR